MLASGANSVTATITEVITGGSGADSITVTGSVSARIIGGDGNDTLVGGDGGDQISGGLGADLLTGGAGVDRFTYSSVNDAPATTGDTITDFNPASDLLVFSGMLTGAFTFLGSAAMTVSGSTQARFDDSTKILLIDLGGDGVADMRITLTGVNLAALDSSAFLWL